VVESRACGTAALIVTLCDESKYPDGRPGARKRTLASFKDFILADLTGVIVHDRYQNYDSAELGEHEHQLCCAPAS
jgi:hypothetical protein